MRELDMAMAEWFLDDNRRKPDRAEGASVAGIKDAVGVLATEA
jgi:hypothetical protein